MKIDIEVIDLMAGVNVVVDLQSLCIDRQLILSTDRRYFKKYLLLA